MSDTRAIAARLTAIADEADRLENAELLWFGVSDADLHTRTEAVAALRSLSAHVETLTQQVAELTKDSERHERMYLAAHADWEASQQENARLTADAHQSKLDALAAARRIVQAEQQRDAAHAALTRIAEHQGGRFAMDADEMMVRQESPQSIARAALAASAPQKD